MANTFVFMGRPGAGKGAQSKLLAEHLGCNVFSTGNRVREIANEDSQLGHRVKEISESGGLTPSWFASFLFEEALLNLKDDENIVFEGVGRKEPEARLFAEICEWLGRDYVVIYLDVSEDTIRDRINKRKVLEKRADDNNLENRFINFNKETRFALEYFRSIGKVIDINGEPLPDEVFKEVLQKLSING